jgi:hypothetical protein
MSIETVKKTKAPAKPRKTAATGTTTTKAKTTAKAKAAAEPTMTTPTHEEIAALAAQYWAERGWQEGAAEQDWLRAEQELLAKAS